MISCSHCLWLNYNQNLQKRKTSLIPNQEFDGGIVHAGRRVYLLFMPFNISHCNEKYLNNFCNNLL